LVPASLLSALAQSRYSQFNLENYSTRPEPVSQGALAPTDELFSLHLVAASLLATTTGFPRVRFESHEFHTSMLRTTRISRAAKTEAHSSWVPESFLTQKYLELTFFASPAIRR
jgi:hypothetical protein